MAKTLWVRVRDEKQQFRKDLIEYPTEAELKKNPAAEQKRFLVDVHGYDELGRPVCPIFPVEDCKEIQNAIHNDLRRDPRPDDDLKRKADGLLIPSRLLEVQPEDVDRFPKWIGHPTINMSADQVYRTVMKINAELKKGNEILGIPEDDAPIYTIRDADGKTDPDGAKLYSLYQAGLANAQKRKQEKKEAVAA